MRRLFLSKHVFASRSFKTRIYYENLISSVFSSPDYTEKSVVFGISKKIWNESQSDFQIFFFHQLQLNSIKYYSAFQQAHEKRVDIELMYKIALQYAAALDKSEELEEEIFDPTDFTEPHLWYPEARKMKRKIIFHTGGTNSGKTFESLNRLKLAKSGVYCAPLRLLATEVWNRLNESGVPCSLMTGDLKRENPDAQHISCTVEMVSLSTKYEVAVIDEIQMISDPDRGHAWTRALLGLQAKEIHICGEPRTLGLLQHLVEVMNEDFEFHTYERKTPLHIEHYPLKDFRDLRKGDCVVTFSRKEVFHLKSRIERSTNLRVAIVYGSLPPECRILSADLFNAAEEFDVLVSTDAIGCGLNLNIGRIIFYKTEKFDGIEQRKLTPSEVKQIGGRAGRFQSLFPTGYVSAFSKTDLEFIRESMKVKNDIMIDSAGLAPNFTQLELYQNEHQKYPFSKVIDRIARQSRMSETYFMCDLQESYEIALLLDDVNLSLKERFIFCMVPIDLEELYSLREFRRYAELHAKGKEIHVRVKIDFDPNTPEQLADVEATYSLLTAYCWLSYQFETTFVDREKALLLRKKCEEIIERTIFDRVDYRARSPRKSQKKISKSGQLRRELGEMGINF